MNWAFIMFVGLSSPVVISLPSMEHCVAAQLRFERNLETKEGEYLKGSSATLCVPVSGPVPPVEEIDHAIIAFRGKSLQLKCLDSSPDCPGGPGKE